MAKPKLSSMLVFGVEWGPIARPAQTGAVDRMAGHLLQRLVQRHFKATWAVRDFRTPIVRRARGLSVAQEIALDAVRETPHDRREGFAFAAWLRDRVEDAECAGIRLRSLALAPSGCVPYHAISKLGIRTIRPGAQRATRIAQSVQPQSLRYGVWGLPVSTSWPQPNRLLHRFARQQVAYAMRRTAEQNAVMHVVFDVKLLAEQGDAGLRG